jgi:hypothetical protein
VCGGNALAVLEGGDVPAGGDGFMNAGMSAMSGAVRGCGRRRKEERRGDQGSEQKRQKHTLHQANSISKNPDSLIDSAAECRLGKAYFRCYRVPSFIGLPEVELEFPTLGYSRHCT